MKKYDLPKYIGDKIKYYRIQNNLTQDDLAKKLDTTKATISNYETGYRTPKQDSLFDLAFNLGISINDLFPPLENEVSSIETIYNKLNEPAKKEVYSFAEKKLEEQINNIVELDSYRDIEIQSKLSAGTGILDLEPNHVETITYYGNVPSDYDMAFEVCGNSMEPLFENGEIVFVKKTTEFYNGQIIVVTINNEAYIKKAYKEDEFLRLVSLNKEYTDITTENGDDIKVVGIVIL